MKRNELKTKSYKDFHSIFANANTRSLLKEIKHTFAEEKFKNKTLQRNTASLNEIKIAVIRKHQFKNEIALSKTLGRTVQQRTSMPVQPIV